MREHSSRAFYRLITIGNSLPRGHSRRQRIANSLRNVICDVMNAVLGSVYTTWRNHVMSDT